MSKIVLDFNSYGDDLRVIHNELLDLYTVGITNRSNGNLELIHFKKEELKELALSILKEVE